MHQYHKIHTVYLRDPTTNYKTLLEGEFSRPEFEYLKDNLWLFEEKVDGCNIRLLWGENGLEFRGKTDKANIPKFLLEKLGEMFSPEMFLELDLPPVTCLYGEGYGRRIQKGGEDYIPDGVSFILFDVRIGTTWLKREDVEDIGAKLNLKVAPLIGEGTLLEGVELVRNGFQSLLRNTPPEGLVMRPKIELLDRNRERIITKLKLKDFNNV